MMPLGEYWVGDLCYVLGDQWEEVCDSTINGEKCLEGEFVLQDGTRFAMYGTAHGDGCYLDEQGHEYPVDSGTLGCVLVKDCLAAKFGVPPILIANFNLGHMFTFGEEFETSSDESVVVIGDVRIETDATDDTDAEMYAEDEDE